jgi:hypothetical protein
MASPSKNLIAPTGVTMRWNNMLPEMPINVSSKRIFMAAAPIFSINPLYSRFTFVVFKARTFITIILPLPTINLIMNRASWRVATTFPPVYQNPRPNFGQLWPRGEKF